MSEKLPVSEPMNKGFVTVYKLQHGREVPSLCPVYHEATQDGKGQDILIPRRMIEILVDGDNSISRRMRRETGISKVSAQSVFAQLESTQHNIDEGFDSY